MQKTCNPKNAGPACWRPALLALACTASALLPARAEIAPDLRAGQTAAVVCVACHQADGAGMDVPGGEPWPRLAGLEAAYIAKQLRDFKAGTRTNPTMDAFAGMLDDAQIVNVAAYYASLPIPAPKAVPATDPALLEKGRKLATQGDWDRYIVPCMSCHGPGNDGVGAVFPAIVGQSASYIRTQLLAWQEGKRSNDPQALMAVIAKRMNADDIAAVSAWLETQPTLRIPAGKPASAASR